jgi:hypothetical protein
VEYPPKLYTFLQVRLELHHGFDKCNNMWVPEYYRRRVMRIHPPLLLQSQDPWAKTSQPTKIHKPTGVAKWGGGDFCTMERLCLSSDGSPYGNQKLQKILLPISAKKSKQSNRCEPHRREWREKMQSGFLSCILCSLLILLQTLYDKLLVDKGSKAIVTTLHFSGNWNFCRLQIRPFLWT